MTIQAAGDRVTAARIARRAGVGRAAGANWRRRYRSLAKLSPGELLARMLVSLLPRLEDVDPADPADEDVEPLTVLDAACADAGVLTAVVERFGDHVRLAGQAPDEAVSAAVRRSLQPGRAELRVGDALRVDRFAVSRGLAWAALCVPLRGTRPWPALEPAADPRRRCGLPDPADAELAWMQHRVAHLRIRGVAVVAMSPASGARPSGRHVRAELVRSGVLRSVISLPAGLTRTENGALQVWVLNRGGDTDSVRMVDLTGLADAADVPTAHAGLAALFASDDPSLPREVPRVELLDGDTSLIPARQSVSAAPRSLRTWAGYVSSCGGSTPTSAGPCPPRPVLRRRGSGRWSRWPNWSGHGRSQILPGTPPGGPVTCCSA